MNKILNINLGGYALTIDDDAYEYLTAYLESIRRRFSESEGRDEIVSDIEARIGELIHQGMGNRTIVMLPEVESAVLIMGRPEDFGGEPTVEETTSRRTSGTSSRPTEPRPAAIRTGKRLFRDPDNMSVAGVCSGLAAYFGMTDPVWMRLIFVALTLVSAGFWMPAYFLLWVLVPQATTAADRLAMRGEPVNAENIAREVEEGFERLSQKVNQAATGKNGPALSHAVATVGNVFAFLIRMFVKFGLLIAIIVIAALFISLLVGWASGIFTLATMAPFVDYLSPFSSGATWLGFANLFFLLGIPVLGLCITSAKALFKVKTPRYLGAGLTAFWILNVICSFAFVTMTVKEFSQSGSLSKNVDLSDMNSDTLRIVTSNSGSENNDFHVSWFDSDDLRLSDDRLELDGPVQINVQRSTSGRFECTQTIRAHGPTNSNAVENASQTEYTVTSMGNTLQIPTSYSIMKGRKWRANEVRITLGIPVGKFVVFGERINNYVNGNVDYSDPEDHNYIHDNPNKMYRMTQDGLACVSCPQFGDNDYREDRDYEKFILEGNFETEIRQGDDFKIRIEGPAGAVRKIRTGDKLTLTANDSISSKKVKIYIETPVFTSLHADNTGEVIIRGFEEGQARISARGNSRIKAYLDCSNLDVSLSGKCMLELTGKGSDLDVSLSDGAVLEATSWRTDHADVSASDGSKARLNVRNNAKVNADKSSEVRVDGGAHLDYGNGRQEEQ